MNENARVRSIDTLRGFALLGILVMNIQAFAMPHAAYLNPSLFGSLEGSDGVAWAVGRWFFDFKFISLFSTLFGASLVLARDASPRKRLGWLVLFGLAHGYLIWFGDVLFTYGVVGMLAVGAREWPVRRLVWVGTSLILASTVLLVVFGVFPRLIPSVVLEDLQVHYAGVGLAEEVEAFGGGWLTQLPVRARVTFASQVWGTLLEAGWRVAGCMLLGMAAVKARVFEGFFRFWPWVPLALLGGLLISGAGVWLQWSSHFELRAWFFAQACIELGSLGLTGGYALSCVALVHRFPTALPLEAAGRLGRVAFSAYLMHSVVGTFVFGGHGLGLYGTWSRSALLPAAFVFWALQLALAWWWTSQFRVGPLEAVWRGLSRGDFSLGGTAPAAARGRQTF
ncbi:MAG: DUF418 domain-containing protein [Archangium sp.]|nr:DUF418 domain-containing protein [Archangium sp.]